MKVYRILRGVVSFYFHRFFHWQVKGRENIPNAKPVILISNHISNYDPLAIACAVERQVHFMAKQELFNIPLVGRLLYHLEQFPVKRGGNDRKAIKNGLEVLKNNNVLGIFPQGTRVKGDDLGEGLPGAAMFAIKSDAVVVPIGIVSTYRWFSSIKINIGKPIDFEEYRNKEKVKTDDLKEALNIMMNQIKKQIDEVKDV